MTECYFVTGTDTGVGKTLVAAGMLLAAAAAGKRTVGLKPIASGAEQTYTDTCSDSSKTSSDTCTHLCVTVNS